MHSDKVRILYLTRNWPHGESFGGQLRTLHIARHLGRLGDLDMGVLSLTPLDSTLLKRTRAEFNLVFAEQMRRQPIRGAGDRLRHEFDRKFLNTEGWSLSPTDAARLSGMFKEYDLVWVHNIAVANGARLFSWPRSVLDVDDLRTEYHRSAMNCADSWFVRARAMRQVWLWKRRESALFDRFGSLVLCSEADRARFGRPERTYVIPNGFELPSSQPVHAPTSPPRIGFIGLLRYPPNVEGIRWFKSEVWPRIKREEPSVRLRLVGSGGDALVNDAPDVDALGWVEDPAEEVASWAMMIVPIRMGGGTRIKIAEGFGRRCPVVSTRLGAFGYQLKTGEEIQLADDPAAFAGACLALLRDRNLGNRMLERAWGRFLREWTWEGFGPRVDAVVKGALRQSGARRAQIPELPAPA